jgi:hypothetical protein
MSTKKFKIEFIAEIDCETLAEGMKKAKENFKLLNIINVKPVLSHRTLAQNNALWLMYSQLADELNEKGIDLRTLIRKEVDIPWTRYSVHEYLWKPLLKVMFGKNSTTKMSKTEEIEAVYDALNRIIIERTKGEVRLPPWPSLETML